MECSLKTWTIFAGLLVWGANAAPAFAEMAPMGPQVPPAAMPGGMEGRMSMPAPSAVAPGMSGVPPVMPARSGAMGDDKMGMTSEGAATQGMPRSAPAPAAGMAAGEMQMMQGMKPMMDTMMGQMAKMQPPPAAPLDHVEGRIAYMKAELAVTDAQAPAWDKFAAALRTSRGHLDEARTALVASKDAQTSVPNRLEAYEHHLSMRLDSLRSARESFQVLYASLSPTQKVSADELAGPLLASF